MLFILGIAIGHFLVLLAMFKYILFYSGDMATAQLSVQDTLSAVTTILVGFGIIFQIPLLVVFTVKMGSVAKIIFPHFDTIILTFVYHFSLDDID